MSDNKVANPNFFRRTQQKTAESSKEEKTADSPKAKTDTAAEVKAESKTEPEKVRVKVKPVAATQNDSCEQPIASPIRIGGKITAILNELTELLNKTGKKSLLPEVEKIKRELERKKFTIAVVGEFSKGKSTFINKLLNREFLPTGNLPTTAMLTKIRYNPKEMLVLFDYKGNKKRTMPLSEKSWDGLTADMNGADPEGVVLAGINSPWLRTTGIEIEDTPGAGDLEEKRARITGEALQCDDGAIITISATAAMSMSETLFIEQRLISPKTPYLMVIITKLDRVPLSERAGIIEYVKSKLKQWKREIPVFVPYDTEMPDDSYKDIIGLDSVKAEIERWVNDPQRISLTEEWIAQRILSVMDAALASLKEQRLLIQADEDKRNELIEQKKVKLSGASVVWDNLRLEMLKRCSNCYTKLLGIVEDNKTKITERLQYEASHAGNPEKWWKEDYPYRLKVEIMNMSTGVENLVSRTITEDIRWLNMSLNNQFKTQIMLEQDDAAEDVRKSFDDIQSGEQIEFEDIGKKRNMVRIGTAALTVAGYCVSFALGAMPIIASIGIGTGSSIISEKVFKGKIEKQQAVLKEVIAKNVPKVIDNATAQTEERIKMKYDEIIESAREKEDSWMAAQNEAIENSAKITDSKGKKTLEHNIADFEQLYARMHKL